MQIVIAWRLNEKTNKWIIVVLGNRRLLALVVRKTEDECRQWAEKNLPVYQRGDVPAYG